MSNVPKVFIIRHGETEWSLNGRHTGTSDIPLTEKGEKRIIATGKALVGEDRLIVPSKLAQIYVSPRNRAQRTLSLLGVHEGCSALVQVDDRIAEWDYGQYEGLTSAQIQEERQRLGKPSWDIWADGCPGGESPQQITWRLDHLINEIRDQFHKNVNGQLKLDDEPNDVLIVAHGHSLRSFAARWINRDIASNPSLILEAGGVGQLSYEHNSISEPALLLGGSFAVPQ